MTKPIQFVTQNVQRIGWLVFLCLLALGCEKRPPRFAEDMRPRKGQSSDNQEQAGGDKKGTGTSEQQSSGGKSEGPVPIVSSELQRKAITSTVRLTVEPEVGEPKGDTGFGSGVIIGKDKSGAVYILTVWHAARHGIRCVDFYDSDSKIVATYSSPEVVGKSIERDLAILKTAVDDDLQFVTVELVADTKTKPAYGYSVGCGSGRPPNVLGERIIGDKVVRFEGSETRARIWITDLPQEGGRSGGALLDPDGRLLGIAIKATADGYYTHAEEIRQFLSESKL